MNSNRFLKMLGLGYLELDKVMPYFSCPDENERYYYKGSLSRFEREIMKAETVLFDRIHDLSLELEEKMNRDERDGENVLVDQDEQEAVTYMIRRITACYEPLIEVSQALESDRKLCERFLEKIVRKRFKIPWSHGYIITEGYRVFWYYQEDLPPDDDGD